MRSRSLRPLLAAIVLVGGGHARAQAPAIWHDIMATGAPQNFCMTAGLSIVRNIMGASFPSFGVAAVGNNGAYTLGIGCHANLRVVTFDAAGPDPATAQHLVRTARGAFMACNPAAPHRC